MDIRTQLLSELSRMNIDFTIQTLGNNKEHFRELISLVLTEKDPLPMRAAWVVEGITAKYPEIILPYMKDLITNLRKFTHPGTLRNILKIFSRMELDEKYHGILADICFEWIAKDEMPVAVKVYAMQILANLTRIYPELKNELFEVIDVQIPRNTAGFKAHARKVKMELNKI
jgi:hypothetical protein